MHSVQPNSDERKSSLNGHRPDDSLDGWPDKLKEDPLWVYWKQESEQKVPYDAKTGKKANVTDLATGSILARAGRMAERMAESLPGTYGVGRILTTDTLMALDLDECVDRQGNIQQWARDFLALFPTRVEYSPTDGLKLFLHVKNKPTGKARRVGYWRGHKVELLIENCYTTVTGRMIPGSTDTIKDCTDEFNAFYATFYQPAEVRQKQPRTPGPRDLSNEELVKRAKASTKYPHHNKWPCSCGVEAHTLGTLFTDRWDGSNAHDGDDDSAGDFNMAVTLAWWCRKDAAWIEEIMRMSPRRRAKWDERRGSSTWLDRLIADAIDYEDTVRPDDDGCTGGCGDDADESESEQAEPYFVTLEDLAARTPARPVVDGYLYEGEDAVLVAQKGVGKSFWRIDWECHIALGLTWHGHEVLPGKVLSIVAEGASGTLRRYAAWCKSHGVELRDLFRSILIREWPLALMNNADVNTFIEQAKRAGWEGAALLSVDTLSQCTQGESENDNGRMAKAMGNVNKIRRALGIAASLTVHHEGHASTGRARGASAIGDNVPAIFRLEFDSERQEQEPEPIVRLHVNNERDEGRPSDMTFKRKIVPSGVYDARGNELTSCVLVPTTLVTKPDEPTEKALPASAKKMLKALPDEGLTSTAWRLKTGMPKRTFYDGLKLLIEYELVVLAGKTYKKITDE